MAAARQGREEAAKAADRLSQNYCALHKKYDKKKTTLERVRKDRDSLKKKVDEVESARASDAAEKVDLEKKFQDGMKNLETIKGLHNEVLSQLEGEKKDREKYVAEVA